MANYNSFLSELPLFKGSFHDIYVAKQVFPWQIRCAIEMQFECF